MSKRSRMVTANRDAPRNRCRGGTSMVALLTVTAAAWASGACASGATVIGHDDSGDAGQAATVSVYEAYGFCSPNIMPPICTELPTDGVPMFAEAPEDCFCFRACDEDGDCPVPNEGTAKPVCTNVHGTFDGCVLSCGDGQTCPQGMTCRPGFSSMSVEVSPVCTWYTPLERNVYENPDACSAYTTKEQCENAFSDYPIPADYTCAWATVGTYARGVAGCEPIANVERCVRVQAQEPASGCDPAQSCAGDTRPVYWQELAGDITLVKVEGCGFPMVDDTEPEFKMCEFGAPSVPTVCDCACGS